MTLHIDLSLPRKDFTVSASLSAPAGQVTAVFGPSGCGKTSLLRAIAGLEPTAQGRITINDRVWQDENQFLPAHQRDIGYVFQDASLFPHLNVFDNLQFGLKRQPKEKQRVSLTQAIELLAIEPLLTRHIDTLSGGERQRVAIARAVATSPQVLLFDEPLAAVDIPHKQDILRYIQSLHRELNIPTLYVSHALDEVARLSDNLIVLEYGQPVASGKTADILSELHLPFAHDEDAAVVLDTCVTGFDDRYGLALLSTGDASFKVSSENLVRGDAVRLRIMARDVSVALRPCEQSSILNTFPVVIESMTDNGISQTLLRLNLEGQILLSRITRKSTDELELKPGMAVFAQIKSVSLFT